MCARTFIPEIECLPCMNNCRNERKTGCMNDKYGYIDFLNLSSKGRNSGKTGLKIMKPDRFISLVCK